jgi:hypothetical protein
MKCSTICAAFFAAVVAASSDVTQLKTDTFKEFVQENDLVLAECKLFSTSGTAYKCDITNMIASLRTMVRPLQGPCPRV